jgi:hypothetical protein
MKRGTLTQRRACPFGVPQTSAPFTEVTASAISTPPLQQIEPTHAQRSHLTEPDSGVIQEEHDELVIGRRVPAL